MTSLGWLGCLALAAACISFVTNVVTAYRTEGGAIGQVPVLAAPVLHQAPLATLGLFCVSSAAGVGVSGWAFLGCFLGTATVGLIVTLWVGNLPVRRRTKK